MEVGKTHGRVTPRTQRTCAVGTLTALWRKNIQVNKVVQWSAIFLISNSLRFRLNLKLSYRENIPSTLQLTVFHQMFTNRKYQHFHLGRTLKLTVYFTLN